MIEALGLFVVIDTVDGFFEDEIVLLWNKKYGTRYQATLIRSNDGSCMFFNGAIDLDVLRKVGVNSLSYDEKLSVINYIKRW